MKGKAWLGIVDADSILYRVAYVTEEDTEEQAIDQLRATVYKSVYLPTKCTKYAFVVSGGESGRSEVAVTKPYKGQRSKEKPKHLSALRRVLIDEYKAFSVDKLEADDVVIAMYEKYRGYALLLGIDKDAKQMAGAHYNYNKDEFFTISDRESQRYFFKQMLMGDTVDNITGIPKIGEKGADKLFDSEPDTPPAKLVWDLYKAKGFDWEYYKEQYYLLRMQRDIIYPFEEHFTTFEDNEEFEEWNQ